MLQSAFLLHKLKNTQHLSETLQDLKYFSQKLMTVLRLNNKICFEAVLIIKYHIHSFISYVRHYSTPFFTFSEIVLCTAIAINLSILTLQNMVHLLNFEH